MCIDNEWKRRLDYSLYTNVDDLLTSMDEEMNILNPVHLRRITLLKTTFKKGEKCSELLGRLNDGAKVSDLRQLTPEGLLLHLFLDKCPEREDTKNIKDGVLDVLREHTQVNKEHVDTHESDKRKGVRSTIPHWQTEQSKQSSTGKVLLHL